LPNIETARGLAATAATARASLRVKACPIGIGSEDLAADLGAERGADGIELAYARQHSPRVRRRRVVAVD
jgi:citrate lyase subunit beta/citryl-CoA lyase